MMTCHLPESSRFIHGLNPTPLVCVRLDEDQPGVWCKLEFLNPSGSIKDRIARYILEKAWRRGQLRAGDRVIEASSGSTSIAMALACAQMNLRFSAIMPEGVSPERQMMIRAFGGEIILCPRQDGLDGALREAERLEAESGCLYTRQFENPDNPEAHRLWTAQEILTQIPDGMVDAVISGVGTGGTIVGLYEAFVESGCKTVPFAARPVHGLTVCDIECSSFSARVPGVVEGISKLYTPARLPNLVELDVADDVAILTTRRLIRRGFPVGPSSGLNYAAAIEAARRLGAAANIVTVFPDRMERYFSSELFADLAADHDRRSEQITRT